VKVSEQSTVPPRAGEEPLPQMLVDNIAARERVSVSAMVARSFVKFDIALRARLLGRLLASVGPLALKVVSGGVFAKYVRHARSPEIPVSFEDAARATSTQVRDLVHYVEQSNPNLVEELSTALSLKDGVKFAEGPQAEVRQPRPKRSAEHRLRSDQVPQKVR
jgi:hypothetical protein